MNVVCVAGFEPAAPRIQSENSDRTELHTENLKRFVLGTMNGGSCGIRTHEPLSESPVFEAGALVHSVKLPSIVVMVRPVGLEPTTSGF